MFQFHPCMEEFEEQYLQAVNAKAAEANDLCKELRDAADAELQRNELDLQDPWWEGVDAVPSPPSSPPPPAPVPAASKPTAGVSTAAGAGIGAGAAAGGGRSTLHRDDDDAGAEESKMS